MSNAQAIPADNARGEARAGLALSIATFAMAAASAAQAVLYLSDFGTSARTDGFFIAFALYTTIGVFSQSLRLTAAPLLVDPGARLRPRELGRALVFLVVPLLVVTIPLAGPLASLLAPGLSAEGRAVTEEALPILGGAVALQLLAAGGATLLAVRSQFTGIAGAYIAGAVAGLLAYGVLESGTGELVLGWSMLTMAVVTFTLMLVAVVRSGGLGERCRSRGVRAICSEASLLLGRTVVYLAFNMLFVVSLAFVSRSAPGDATIFSYAYLFASYLVAGTATALGMSRIPEMTRKARAQQRATVRATVPVGFRYAMLLVAPAMLGLVTAGAPLVGELFPASLDAAGVETLRTFGALLIPWTMSALLVNLLLPLMFAIGRAYLVNVLAIPIVPDAPCRDGGRQRGTQRERSCGRPERGSKRLRGGTGGRRGRPVGARPRSRGAPRRRPLPHRRYGRLLRGAPAGGVPVERAHGVADRGGGRDGRLCAAAPTRGGAPGHRRNTRATPARGVSGPSSSLRPVPTLRVTELARSTLTAERVVVGSLVLLFAAVVALTWRKWGVPEVDAGAELSTADLVAHGSLPYEDVRYFYGPAGVYSLAGAFAVFGSSFTTAFAFGLAQAAAILAAFYVLCRHWLTPLSAGLATAVLLTIGFSGTPYNFVLPHTNSATFGLLFLLLELLALTRGRTLLAGGLLGATALTRPEFAAAAALAAGAYLVGMWRDENGRAAWHAAIRLALPAVGVAGAVLGLFAAVAGPHRLFLENLWPVDFIRSAGFKTQSYWMPFTAASGIGLFARAAIYCGLVAAVVIGVARAAAARGSARVTALWPLAVGVGAIALGFVVWKVSGVASAEQGQVRDGAHEGPDRHELAPDARPSRAPGTRPFSSSADAPPH